MPNRLLWSGPGLRPKPRLPALVSLLAAVLLVLSGTLSAAGSSPSPTTVPAAAALPTAPVDRFDSATRDDEAFNKQFEHKFATVHGVRMHYVTGGRGPALVLLHGWPQSWFEWRAIMPALARHYTVYAVDLPGLGDSRGAPPNYAKATLARYVHGLIAERLGHRGARVVGHDLGAAVAFQYAAQFPAEVHKLGYLDLPLPGPAIDAATYRTLSWHIAFHAQKRIPESVVSNDVRDYLALFYPQVAYGGVAFGGTNTRSPFTEAEIDEYARTYSRPQALHGGFELYRTLDADVRDNIAAAPVRTPTLLLTAEGQLDAVRSTVAPRLRSITHAADVPGAGHWLVEENPRFVTSELLRFLAG